MPIQLQKIDLEYVNFSRIEKAVKKYERLQSKAKWMKRFKYAVIGAGCAGLGMLILNQWFNTQDKAQGKAKDQTAAEKQSDSQDLEKEYKVLGIKQLAENGTMAGRIKNGALGGISLIAGSVVMVSFWKIIENGGNTYNDYFAGIDLQDSDFYKQKNEKINGLIQRLGLFLMNDKQNFHNNDAASMKFFDLVFADVLIDHTTLVRWFEDFVGFIKCAVILNNGNDSLELACLEKDIEVLSGKLNKFTDEISIIINSPDVQERSKQINPVVDLYLNFCKQFSKFIYDCGLYLYEDDFLRK